MLEELKKGIIMNTDRTNQENVLAIEIEELEGKITPTSAATFLD